MGGRGGGGGFAWKKQLRAMAKEGKMPAYFSGGTAEMQAQVFKEIDKLYDMPQVKAKITDQGTRVHIIVNGVTVSQAYPSGVLASESEKRGVLKMALYNTLQKK